MKTLNIIVPCYNEEENVRDLYAEVMKQQDYFAARDVAIDITYIDDGSTDATTEQVKRLHEEDGRVHLIRFSRNFGKEAAIYAGLTKTTGDYCVVMDCDLQDPPAMLPQMYEAIAEEGFDSAATRRVTRKGEPVIRSFFARRFYRIINKMSGIKVVDGARDFRMMTRQFANAITQVKEYNRFSKGIYSWVGFDTKWLEYENVARNKGETKWSFWKLFVYALEGIVAFSSAPLAAASVMGIVCFVIALCALIFIFVRALLFGDPTSGWPSMVCILLLVSGVQMFFIGIVGQYLAKTYLEVKERPIFIEKESL